MTHMLDTDTLSVWESDTGPDHAVFLLNLSAHAKDSVGVSVVSFQEQTLGCHNYLNKAKSSADLVEGYLRWLRVIETFRQCAVVPFNTAAADIFADLKRQKIRIGTMDLRIAAVALAHNLILVTRNVSDFSKVPGLRTEDWTK